MDEEEAPNIIACLYIVFTFFTRLYLPSESFSSMPPSRRTAVSDPSSSKRSSEPRHKKIKRSQSPSQPASDALPGVQKIKAALRQTRRLLAKDKLAADVRVATERRLKSLEGDLARAEQARLERTMATRYHKVKFFERRKVTRKLVQTKRLLAEASGKKERRKLEAQMAELRVDLNYILHYPKAKKYISLFPPEARQGSGSDATKAKDDADLPETDRQREEVRQWVRAQMDLNAFSLEPEAELEQTDRKAADFPSQPSAHKEKNEAAVRVKGSGVADDEFFALDENNDGGSDGSDGDDNESEDE